MLGPSFTNRAGGPATPGEETLPTGIASHRADRAPKGQKRRAPSLDASGTRTTSIACPFRLADRPTPVKTKKLESLNRDGRDLCA